MAQVTPDQTRLLRALRVLGERSTLAEILTTAEAQGLTPKAAGAALAELVEAGMVSTLEPRAGFDTVRPLAKTADPTFKLTAKGDEIAIALF
jgi:hypothetical protein